MYNSKGEGIFINYNFSKCNNYKIEIVLKDASVNFSPMIYIYAANGIPEAKIDTTRIVDTNGNTVDIKCKISNLPSISDKEIIHYTGAGCSGTWALVYQCTLSFPPSNAYYNPNKDYKQLWIYTSTNSDTGAFFIKKITITDYGKIESIPPTVPENLRATNITSNSITIQWNPSTDASGIEEYEIFDIWGDKIATTKNTQYSRYGLMKCTNYKFEVRARDKFCNNSAKATIWTKTTAEDNYEFDTPVQPRIIEAESYILFKPGFSVEVSGNESFQAIIGCK